MKRLALSVSFLANIVFRGEAQHIFELPDETLLNVVGFEDQTPHDLWLYPGYFEGRMKSLTEKEVEDPPPVPAKLDKSSVENWVNSAIQNTTTVMIVWKGKEPFKPVEGVTSAADVIRMTKHRVPEIVLEVLEKALNLREFPDNFDRAAVLELLRVKLDFRERHLKFLGQSQLKGVPQVAAQQVADYVVKEYPDNVKVTDVDAVVSMMDPVETPMNPGVMPQQVEDSTGRAIAAGPAAGYIPMLG